ncbi:hypothetical protein B0H16DRAFT_1747751 [Mycena metata]|uniref:Uncharacterized protein n=1 Tax=Mycena metata TaxID=1033252 RepID=A0AAD7M743_9AGAR|nr:hypothetical protein B0H16DRAFT_1747751 [Mycena metata]
MSAPTHADIGARNIKFMRILFATDACELESSESLGMLLPLMRTEPNEPRISVIDYTNGEATPRITLLAEERAADTHRDVRWDDHLARAAASGGRMELRVMIVWDGKRKRRLMFPTRSVSSEVPDELMRISREVPEDTDALDSMKKFLAENGRLLVHQ